MYPKRCNEKWVRRNLQSNNCGGKYLRRPEGSAEFGGDLFEGFLPLEMRDAFHAPTPIVQVPEDEEGGGSGRDNLI